ncbi:MAG: hypothetical protein U1E83_02340 [Methylotetracoccus sp.]
MNDSSSSRISQALDVIRPVAARLAAIDWQGHAEHVLTALQRLVRRPGATNKDPAAEGARRSLVGYPHFRTVAVWLFLFGLAGWMAFVASPRDDGTLLGNYSMRPPGFQKAAFEDVNTRP